MAWTILIPPNEIHGAITALAKDTDLEDADYVEFTSVEHYIKHFATERAARKERLCLIARGKCRHSAQVVWLGVDGKIRYPEDAPEEKEPFHP